MKRVSEINLDTESSDSDFSSEDEMEESYDDEEGDAVSLGSSVDTSSSREQSSLSYLTSTSKGKINVDFTKELKQTLDRAFEDDLTEDVAALELNTLRMAYDADYAEIRQELMGKMLEESIKPGKGGLTAVFKQWSGLMRRVTHSSRDQITLIFSLQVF